MYDLDKLKEISCEDICRKYGISLTKKNNRLWGKLRAEDTPSFAIRIDKNKWDDFGSGKNGDSIQLIAELENIDRGKAVIKLAELFQIDSKTNKEQWTGITNNQYKLLGIEPERATLNLDIDLNKHPIEIVEYWDKKYGVPILELAKKYPNSYNKLLEKKALPKIKIIREIYFNNLDRFKTSKPGIEKDFHLDKLKSLSKEINLLVDLYKKAYIGTENSISNLKVNLNNDLNSKDLGNVDYKELKANGNVEYRKYDKNIGTKIVKKLNNDNIKYCAFTKEDKNINLAFSKSDSVKVNQIVNEFKKRANEMDK